MKQAKSYPVRGKWLAKVNDDARTRHTFNGKVFVVTAEITQAYGANIDVRGKPIEIHIPVEKIRRWGLDQTLIDIEEDPDGP